MHAPPSARSTHTITITAACVLKRAESVRRNAVAWRECKFARTLVCVIRGTMLAAGFTNTLERHMNPLCGGFAQLLLLPLLPLLPLLLLRWR